MFCSLVLDNQAKEVAKNFKRTVYLNYDNINYRNIINEMSWLDDIDLLILNELHKKDGWKNYLKGVFDTKPDNLKIFVKGSARLNIFEQVGDSLAGRYYKHRLMPFTLHELIENKKYYNLDHYINRSGLPERYLEDNDTYAKRWRDQ